MQDQIANMPTTARVVPLRSTKGNSRPVQHLICSCREGWHVIPFNEIAYCVAQSNYVSIAAKNGQMILTAKTLQVVQNTLPKQQFVRAHQSYLVAIDRIRMLTKTSLILACGAELPVSRGHRKQLKDAILKHGIKLE